MTKTTYSATIRHHSIARARVIECGSDLTAAKRKAAREFGAEQIDYDIAIFEHRDGVAPEMITSRKVGGGKWQDRY